MFNFNSNFMRNDIFKLPSKRVLFSAMMVSALLAGSPQTALAGDTDGVLAVMQESVVKGKIVDAIGEPVIGASVQVKGTSTGVISDINGNFSIAAPGDAVLVISYVGYRTQEIKLNGRMNLNIKLEEDAELLDEVVVVGYGTQKKASLTSAISQIKGEEAFKDRSVSNATVALQGSVPGLTITRGSSRPGSEDAKMQIRGSISVNGDSSPLVLIDGVTGSLDELNSMDANDIENISVLKDASAAIYGARSAAGVILVTTKRGKKGKAQITYNGSFTTSINGIETPLTTNEQFLDMFYEAQYNDYAVQNPELAGKIGEDGNSALEGLGGFWWIFGSVVSGNDVNTGESYINRKMWEALRNGKTLTLNNNGVVSRYAPGTYLMDEMYGSSFSQKHSVSIAGADEKFSYRASLGFADNNSQLKIAEDGEKKYNARLNMDYQATKILKLESGMSYERRDITAPSTDVGAGYYDPWFWPLQNENGQWYDTFGGRNPIAGLTDGGHINTDFNILRANMKATLDLSEFVKGLSFSASGAYKQTEKNVQTQKNMIQYYDWEGNAQKNRQGPGSLKEEFSRWTNYNVGAFVNYNRVFNGIHNVSAMLGMTAEDEKCKKLSAERNKGPMYDGSGLSDLDVYVSSTSNKAGGGQNSWAFLSYVTRLSYGYKDKYLVDFLGRRDGSSKLSDNQRWKNFYSISGAWVLSEEKFMESTRSWLDFLKLRYNYGKTGSVEGIGDYERYATIKTGTAYFGSGDLSAHTSAWIDGMRSSNRTWETLDSHDFGVDVTVLNNRLSATFDWFRKTNNGMFIPVTYPSLLGASAPKTNNGKFRSQGWELSMNWRDKVGEVTYNIGAQLSDAKSEVMALENSENVPNEGTNKGRLVGKPLNAIYVYQTDGIFKTQAEVDEYYNKYYWNADKSGPKPNNIIPAPQEKKTNTLRPGARKVADANGDGAVTKDDLVYAGDAAPHLTFGIKAGLEWKGIDFSVFFQGVGKQKVLRTGNIYAPWVTNYTLQNASYMGKMWSEENPNTEYTIASRDAAFNRWNYQNKDVSVQDSKYIRLKSLVVGYTLPQTWTRKIALNKVRIYFSGDDLWEWTKIKDGYDPEHGEASNSTFPFSRLLSFGVDVTF